MATQLLAWFVGVVTTIGVVQPADSAPALLRYRWRSGNSVEYRIVTTEQSRNALGADADKKGPGITASESTTTDRVQFDVLSVSTVGDARVRVKVLESASTGQRVFSNGMVVKMPLNLPGGIDLDARNRWAYSVDLPVGVPVELDIDATGVVRRAAVDEAELDRWTEGGLKKLRDLQSKQAKGLRDRNWTEQPLFPQAVLLPQRAVGVGERQVDDRSQGDARGRHTWVREFVLVSREAAEPAMVTTESVTRTAYAANSSADAPGREYRWNAVWMSRAKLDLARGRVIEVTNESQSDHVSRGDAGRRDARHEMSSKVTFTLVEPANP